MSKQVDEKLTEIQVDVAEINVTLKRNTEDLEKHIKRTNILQDKISKVEGMFILFGIICTIITVVASFYRGS